MNNVNPDPSDHSSVAEQLLARVGDTHLGVRTHEQDWTWDQTVRESATRASMARSLRADGPFHIGVLLENVPEFLFWLGGAALTGATIIGINSTRRGSELEQEIRYVDCQLIITDAAGKALLAGLDLGLAEDRFLLVDSPEYAELLAAHRVGDDDEITADSGVDGERVDEDSLFLLLFTSGTTGMSKAVKCSQGRLARLGYSNARKYGTSRADVSYCCMPLFHGNALMALWAPSLAVGATVVLTPKFTASRFLADVRFFGATFFTYVGKALGYLMLTPEQDDDADNTLTHGFGTEASPDDQREFVRRFGAEIFEGYGSSEGAGSVRRDPEAPEGALGRPAHAGIAIVDPDTLLERGRAVLDEHGRVLNPDEAIGEMVNKEGVRAFEGYYKNDAADSDRIRNGWYWTGDLGYIDTDGFIYFAGRKGDWIRIDGENTSALLIERVIRRYPQVVTAVAFAVPDPRSGDQVMAAIEIEPGESFDAAHFRDFLGEQADLGTKATPRFLRVSTGLPTTGSNKVQKSKVKDDAWRTADPVLWWVGRGAVEFTEMSEADKSAHEAEFEKFGRQRFLGDLAVQG